MSHCRICVVKVGGSLLANADLAPRLLRWLRDEASQRDTHHVLVVGGGKLVDAVRDIDRITPLGDEAAHWIAVELLDVTARLVAATLTGSSPEPVCVDHLATLRGRCEQPGSSIFGSSRFLREVEPHCAGTRLDRDWSVTSDSIAGRLSVVLAADELVLLKSAPPPGRSNGADRLRELASARYVDRFLPHLEGEMPPIRLIDFCSWAVEQIPCRSVGSKS